MLNSTQPRERITERVPVMEEESITEKEKKDEGSEEDPRLNFIFTYLSKTMKLKQEKWVKMMGNDENREIVMEFLDKTTQNILIMTVTSAATVIPILGFPSVVKSKSCYFIRRQKEVITADNYRDMLLFGDIAPKPVDQLQVWVDEICVPLLSNPYNQRGWPKIVADDVEKHVHTLKNTIYQVKGKMQGQTLLPMPIGIERVHMVEKQIIETKGEDIDLVLKSSIEGIIIKWATQVADVLREDSADAFSNGQQPTPAAEIEFWEKRLQNLECIYDQLRDPRVKKMGTILELTKSAYFPSFKSTFRNIVSALTEARNISAYLKPLQKYLDIISNTSFNLLEPVLQPLMHTVCLIWGHCRYYCTSTKIIILIKEICNLFIQETCRFLDPGSIFQGEVDESLLRVASCISVLEAFRKIFDEYRNRVASFFPKGVDPVLWNFHPKVVFERKIKFLKRLRMIKAFFTTVQEFFKLEKIEIGGLKGRILSKKVSQVFQEFGEAFAVFSEVTYDPLSPEDDSFEKDYETFQKHITDLDHKLAAIFCQAFDDCHSLENIFKLIQIIGLLLEREIIKAEINPRYSTILTMLESELDTVKILFDKGTQFYVQNKYITVDHNFPPIAGAIMWIYKLRQRISVPVSSFKSIENPIISTPTACYVMDKYEEMLELLETFEKHLYSSWVAIVPETCRSNLEKTLMIRNPNTLLLQLNFSDELVAVLHEIRYMKMMKIEDLPEDGLELFARSESVRNWVDTLNRTIVWYNQIRQCSHPVEFDLIVTEVENIDTLIAEAQANLDWNSEDGQPQIEQIHDLVKGLHDRVMEAQNNVSHITDLMYPWSVNPLFERRDRKKENLLYLEDYEDQVHKRYNEISEAGFEIHEIIEKNFKLFYNISEPEPTASEERIKEVEKEMTLLTEVEEEELEDEKEIDSWEEKEGDGHEYELQEGSERDVSLIEDGDGEGKVVQKESEAFVIYKTESHTELLRSVSEKGEGVEEIEKEDKGVHRPSAKIPRDAHEDRKSSMTMADDKESLKPTIPKSDDDKEGIKASVKIADDTKEDGEYAKTAGDKEDKKKRGSRKSLQEKTALKESEKKPSVKASVKSVKGKKTSSASHSTSETPSDHRSGPPSDPEPGDTFIQPEKLEKKWWNYVKYIDDIVCEGLFNAIACSMSLFVDEMVIRKQATPLFEVSLELQEPYLSYNPSLDLEDPNGFYVLIGNLLRCIINMSELIPRVMQNLPLPGPMEENEEDDGERSHSSEEESVFSESDIQKSRLLHYKEDMEKNSELNDMQTEIMCRVRLTLSEAIEFSQTFDVYSYLWLEDRPESLQQFLRYGRPLTPEELEIIEAGMEDKLDLKEQAPMLQQFKLQVDQYEELYTELEKIETEKILSDWFRIDLRPFKQALLNTVCKWGNMFKQYLVNDVVRKLSELSAFIEEADKGLLDPVESGDYNGLIRVIKIIYHIKERQAMTDDMFEPLKDTIDLLKAYDVEFSEEVYVQLQDLSTAVIGMDEFLLSFKLMDIYTFQLTTSYKELPEKWTNSKKIAVTVKQTVTPLMTAEVNLIRKRINYFDLRQLQFRETFRNLPLFQFNCADAYELLDKTNKELESLENEMASLQEQSSMFEVNFPEFKPMKMCRKEIRMLKVLWDYVNIIYYNIEDWKTTPWRKIDVEAMDMECKKFSKELRGLDKEMRGWNTYTALEGTIKNLLTSLRAVTELQNPAIRERHWQQLMAATKVKFVMDDETTLSDLLALNLHEYEEEVKNIVDKSVKEMSMEKVLKDLNITWSAMEFEYEVHPRTGLTLPKVSEELIEILEDNQVQLQNLMSSKYIAYFLEEVSDWQGILSNADQVIQIWFEVQRTWQHLESIFIGSEDIRKQLPDDSRRFEKIDHDFKEMLKRIVQTPNVIKATNKQGLYESLEGLQQELTLCEKALAEYLETKRLAFPRFYFVSSADLLDILSNGNQPELVTRHLTKLYDSIAKLKFSHQGGERSKIAHGMFAKDGEYVEMKGDCDCSGKVEVWLNQLTDAMRRTIRHYFGEAVVTYDEKPREQWLFDYPAQASLCGTQIWWTSEVNIAFARLEEGYENAVKDYQKKQILQLSVLISLLLGDLTKGDRQKIMTICTIDVHSRDVVAKLIQMKVENSSAFQWQSQLRHRWDYKLKDCFCNICDAQFRYAHEYLGNTPRLVITPLTDRCYITLTQSLHLIMGGAPAGPAGTGKTETTKDLGRAMGVMVYVFNCSEQMDYKSCGNIYKGLAQTGAWGCFDEFNRISVEVLSVVSVQVKSVLDAIKAKKTVFNFMGEIISLIPTVGMFITMNPGYAGRTELPENLKALFRPCAMVVPDFELICEIMLVAEGFQEARILARKFITLYTLCRELLSKQDHYDWGLRAIKSVLVVAGSLKRGDRDRPEDQVLMRALRDFNIPKIVTDDIPIFMGLIGDLFPALDVPRKRNLDFEKMVKQAAIDLKLQPEENFILKVVQLEELLEVRHSVFIVGNAGTGKTMVWRTLFKTYQNQKRKPYYNDLNPKAVTNDELFGIINPATREWKDGLFSVLMRDQANMSGDSPKWIVLDGDIDPMWIESLNTVMDDNKVLTLASNERIALTPVMRLLFEISNLRTATPATVSRAGILYINPQDLGWNPFVTSWIESRPLHSEKANLIILFDKYIPPCLEVVRTKMKKITPIAEICHIQMLCYLLDCLLTPANVPADCPKEWYEIYFVFACVWAFGSTMFQDQLVDYRSEFSKWWTNEFKTIKFPFQGTVFNYFIEHESKKFIPWTERVKHYDLDYEVPLQATLVDTAETTRVLYFMDLLMEIRAPVMLVGAAGSGKSVIIREKLSKLPEHYSVTNVPFNFYTTSEMLQKVLEKPLEKKAGRNYGPPGNKIMIYCVDDMNMPEVDTYGTVQPHTLIRQHMDYGHWYDRTKLSLKDIHNCQYVSSMNPTAGSFTINPRLQRHFCVFAVSFPAQDPLFHIYVSILGQHLTNSNLKIPSTVGKFAPSIVNAAIALHTRMSQLFLPTAVKFHYIFNLRDLSNIMQAMLYSTAETVPTETDLVRLFVHETERVYGDKLVDASDRDSFKKVLADAIKKNIEGLEEAEVFRKPLIFCHFSEGLGEGKYMPIHTWAHLSRLLEEAMNQYNDLVAAMNLVLFEDAMSHVCRISRILEGPRGNALLVGVGGSGKQSLSRLSAFISSLEVFQVQLKKGYSLNDLKSDLAVLYLKAGLKSVGIMFLMTDAQVAQEKFLVLINDMLTSGEIPELFADDEVDNLINAMRNEVKQAGLQETKENCWKFFIDRVRRQIKVVLCFSPVGSTLRIRSRKFPAVTNCTAINWFHEWPQDALVSVSSRFLEEIEILSDEIRGSVSLFMAYVHTSVNDMSQAYLQNERRYNYTTPKSFLEQINLYIKLLTQKNTELQDRILRLENGLEKLASTGQQVDGLKEILAVQEVELKVKNEAADKLIQVVGVETEKVSKEKAIAAAEELKVRVIEEDVTAKQKMCEEDLKKAEPALIAAQEALNTLNKNNLTELKSFGSPPTAVVNVCAAVMVLFAPRGKIPKDRSWKECKIMMGRVDAFLDNLINYDKENIHAEVIKALQPYLKDPEFDPDTVRGKSFAAAGLCAWVINIMKFYDVYVVVEPKRRALNQANAELAAAREKLVFLNDKINELEQQLSVLTNEFEIAVSEKMKCQAEADATAMTIDLANRLVNGLASENVRWRESVAALKSSGKTLPGDVLMVTAFISYVGCFTRKYRIDLQEKCWFPFLKKLAVPIPMTDGLEPLSLLTDDTQVAKWNNEGLPSDYMSTENATILTNSERWPLMIDPQLQGIKWIKNKYGSALKVIRLGQRSYLDIIEIAVSEGKIVLIENIGETVDAVLDPLLGRNLIKKGRAIKMGDKEVDYNPAFRLILHTKLGNPHYKPEMQAQTTLINFTVTRDGLEEQLLTKVVKAERPDLENLKSELTKQQNTFKITLKTLEDDLLQRLAAAGDDILSDTALVTNLETTKRTAGEIENKVAEAKITSVQLDEAREQYRPVAKRASLLYFILNDLNKINPIYQFSLKAFSVVFQKALATAVPEDNLSNRVVNLLDSLTFSVFMYTSRGLFECDKLIFMAQMTIQILLNNNEIDAVELDFLLRFPVTPNVITPVDFLSNTSWGGIKTLSTMDEFRNLDRDIEGSAKRWKKIVDSEIPEKEKFPQEWKNKTSLQKLCMMRALRPDRMTYAVRSFIEEKLGTKYIEARSVEFAKSYEEMSSTTPVFFILSPGVDPLKDVEQLGKKLRFTFDKKNFHNVSLGQGQEPVAEEAMEIAARRGHWVILQNIHLVANWLPSLEKKMEHCHTIAHPKFRLFMSAEPALDPSAHIIPQGILESSIKITNEPPTGMQANLHKALDSFTQETLEMCTKEAEFKAILFSLCYFHAVVAERRKFGAQGWNRSYPFNLGDLTISVHVLYNYLENSSKIPWEDLRYLFGEIMYGGHITDDWDRHLCKTYLGEYMQPLLMEGDLFFAPGFLAPPNTDYTGYHNYIDDALPPESPYLYGLHPNAEIGFLTTTSEKLFRTIFEMQPRDSGSGGGATVSKEDKVKQVLDEIYDKLPEPFNIADIMAKVEDRTPYIIVAFQECERMNNLTMEMKRSLRELSLGLKGELTITSEMETLEASLLLDQVPDSWSRRAYPSLLPLGSWFGDFTVRLRELESWASDFQLPTAVWLAGFFNPQSFLTAIMQSTARKNEWPLDKMCLHCEVTKKQKDELSSPPREGAYIHGLYMEGARWDMKTSVIVDARLKELFPMMPVVYIKAITQDKQDLKNMYQCPVYKTRSRGPTYVWTFNLKSRERPAKWTLAGVAVLLQI